VCLTVAETGEGVDTLLENIFSHKNYLYNSGKLIEKRERRKADQVRDIVRDTLDRRIEELITSYKDVKDEKSDPYSLANNIISRMDF